MALTEKQIIEGFWYWDPVSRWPPEPTTYIEDYSPGERLNLNITQLDASDHQQRKIVDQWCQVLPGLREVKFLWFSSRVNQKMFEAACQMPNLVGLNIKWSGIKTIDSLTQLKKLRHFSLGASAQVGDIEPLGELTRLVTLELEQLSKIKDFSLISRLEMLEGLGIDGSIWTTQQIETLKPLEKLRSLKYLTLTNAKVIDQSLEPLMHLGELVRFNCSWNFPEAEFKKLNTLPRLKYGNVETSWEDIKNLLG